MSQFTITNLRSELRTHLGEDSIDLPNTDADLLLNRSKWKLEEELKLPQNTIHTSFVTIASVAEYAQTFPVDYIISLAVVDTVAEKLNPLFPISEDTYLSQYKTDAESEDMPASYLMRGTILVLYPTPDQIYTIEVTRKELLTDLSDTNTTISSSNALQEILLLGAVVRGFLRRRDYNSANRMRDIVRGLISSYVESEVKEQGSWKYAQVTPIVNRYEP